MTRQEQYAEERRRALAAINALANGRTLPLDQVAGLMPTLPEYRRPLRVKRKAPTP